MSIKVNTQDISDAASQIADINQKISEEFTDVDTAIKKIDTKWTGTSAYLALKSFISLKDTYYDQRYSVINDLVNFMLIQTGESYEYTETVNVSNASAFK